MFSTKIFLDHPLWHHHKAF